MEVDTAMVLGNDTSEGLDNFFDPSFWEDFSFPTTAFAVENETASAISPTRHEPVIAQGEIVDTPLATSNFQAGPTTINTDTQQSFQHVSLPNAVNGHVELDSDASWGEHDEHEDWSFHLRQGLLNFRVGSGCLLVTEPLSSQKRRKVHSMSYLMGLSHMSILDGQAKRVLISKCLIKTSNTCVGKIWNPSRECWSSGSVDPLAIAVTGWTRAKDFDEITRLLLETLAKASLPLPTKWIEPQSTLESRPIAILHYDDARSAYMVADACARLLNHPKEGELVIFRIGYHHTLLEHTLSEFRVPACPSYSADEPRNVYTRASNSQPERPTPYGIGVRSGRNSSYISESSAGETSAGSSYSFVSEYRASSRSTKKRKYSGGYVCQAHDCFMTFDRECDRRKHEKIHSDNRPHICSDCSSGFLWPKDLRRHQRRHHADQGEEPVVTEGSHPQSEEEALPEFDPLS